MTKKMTTVKKKKKKRANSLGWLSRGRRVLNSQVPSRTQRGLIEMKIDHLIVKEPQYQREGGNDSCFSNIREDTRTLGRGI